MKPDHKVQLIATSRRLLAGHFSEPGEAFTATAADAHEFVNAGWAAFANPDDAAAARLAFEQRLRQQLARIDSRPLVPTSPWVRVGDTLPRALRLH